MVLQLNIVGGLLSILAIAHGVFPIYFNWKHDLAKLSLINRQMMEVHTFFIALTVLLMGILCLTSAPELLDTPLGNRISIGFGLFWLVRLIIQFVGYSPKLWLGKRFETIMHILFILLWTYVSTVFFLTGLKGF